MLTAIARHNAGGSQSVQLSSLSAPPGTLDVLVSTARATWDLRPHQSSESDVDDDPHSLNDDIFLDIFSRLDGRNRQAVGATCRRMRLLSHGTFKHLAMDVPLPPRDMYQNLLLRGQDIESSGVTEGTGPHAIVSPNGDKHLGMVMPTMTSITLQLPSYGSVLNAARCVGSRRKMTSESSPEISGLARPTDALDLFLANMLSGCGSGIPSLPVLEELNIKPHGSDAKTCQISYEALASLAVSAPSLRKLYLPLLSPLAARAIAMLPRTLSSLSVMVSDSPSIDHIVRIPGLKHLSISTREGLLYVVLSLSQVYSIM